MDIPTKTSIHHGPAPLHNYLLLSRNIFHSSTLLLLLYLHYLNCLPIKLSSLCLADFFYYYLNTAIFLTSTPLCHSSRETFANKDEPGLCQFQYIDIYIFRGNIYILYNIRQCIVFYMYIVLYSIRVYFVIYRSFSFQLFMHVNFFFFFYLCAIC